MTSTKFKSIVVTMLLIMGTMTTYAKSSFRGIPEESRYEQVKKMPAKRVSASVPRYAVPASELSGKYYAEWDALDTGLKRKGYTGMPKLTIDGNGNVTIENLCQETCTLKGTYDATSSTLSIPFQPAFQEEGYGTFNFCYFDAEQKGFSTQRPVTFIVQSDGTLKSTSGWCFIVSDSSSSAYGVAADVSLGCTLTPSNAEMSGEILQSNGTFVSGSYPLYVSQASPDELIVANFTNNGTEVRVSITSKDKVSIEPQMIIYSALTGAYCIYATNWSASKPSGSGSATGDIQDNTKITFGQWGVFNMKTKTSTTGGMKTSTLTMNPGKTFTIPESTQPTFSGSGTEADPYQIATPQDMYQLALSVNGGNKYTGSYFKLTSDIDYTNIETYRPIGLNATKCFDGSFDGNGHTISNINIQRGAGDYTGLFGYAGANSSISNLNVNAGSILSFGKYNGFIAGYTLGSISKCKVNGSIRNTADYTGGIVGVGKGINACDFTGTIVSEAAFVGGIAGQMIQSSIVDCKVQATINSYVASTSISHAVGGIVGGISANATNLANVERCYFVGSLYDNTGYAHLGGIAGSLARYVTVSQCASMGLMSSVVKSAGTGSCGGVIGYCSEGTVENCYASNQIAGKNVSNKTGGICGIVAKSTAAGTAKHNVFTGQVIINGFLSPEASIYGKVETGCVVEDNWFDAQIGGASPEGNGLSTSALTGLTLPGELKSSDWSVAEGSYLYPAKAPQELRPFATVPLFLAANNTAKNVKTSFNLGSAQNVSWLIYDNSKFATETTALKMDGNTVELKGVVETAYMVAGGKVEGSTYLKMVTLMLAPPQFEGSGSEQDPYQIKTSEDLKKINNLTLQGQDCEGDYFRLVNDIDMSGVGLSFIGIADYAKTQSMFNGVFDGNGKAIKNWKADGIVVDAEGKADTKNSVATIALFNQIGPKGIVKNVTIDSSCSLRGYAGVAGIASVSYGTVDNCRNFADITICQNYVGGIVARMMEGAKTINCYNAGTITSGCSYAGGIVSDIKENTLVKGCLNVGLVQTKEVTQSYSYADTQYAGGIVSVNAKGSNISNCLNVGSVSSDQYVGGIIAGYSTDAFIEGCINIGLVKSEQPTYAGAIIGRPIGNTGLQNVYYDQQILILGAANGTAVDGVSGSYTSTLTSGNILEGLDGSIWQFNAGMYPTLKAFAEEDAASAYRRMVVTLSDGETVNEMTSTATLASFQGIVWSLPDNETAFKISNNKLSFADLTAPATVALTSTLGKYSRTLEIQGINNPFKGEGTEANPFQIANAADMTTLSKYTTEYGARYENKYFAMTADIDMKNADGFNLISFGGTAEFRGNFDGKNHSVSNLTINRADKTDVFIGLFGTIGAGGYIKNLTIGSGSINGYSNVGAISGKCSGTIENCVNRAEVNTVGGTTSNIRAGGLVGSLEKGGCIKHSNNYGKVTSSYTYSGGIAAYAAVASSIKYCNNYGEVSTAESRNYAGGIMGSGGASLDSCVNYGNVKATSYIGGIAGQLDAGKDPVISCVNKGMLISDGSYAGGIAGNTTAEIQNCVNYSDITATADLGGIVGMTKNNVYDCTNYGKIKGIKNYYVGGIAGYVSGSLIRRCVNRGDSVTSVGYSVGGIAGAVSINSSSVDSCINYAHVVTTGANGYKAGGIAGDCSSKINDCINYGSVRTESYATGGIVGGGNGSSYRNINAGNVSTIYDVESKKNGNAGGIWGDAGGTISDCINYGNVAAKRYCAGIAGRPGTSSEVKNCYFSGTLTTDDPATSGAIVNKESTMTKLNVADCYYNSDLNPEIKQSELAANVAKPVTSLEMRNVNLGEAYDYHNAAMPTLKVHASEGGTNACAALIIFANGESAENFLTVATIPMLPGIEWSATDNIEVGNGIITNSSKKNDEKAIVYVKGGIIERSFNLVIPIGSYVEESLCGKEIERKMLFNMQGISITSPVEGEIILEVIKYTDGTVVRRKVMYSK